VVVDAIAEQFSPPFAIQEADRSGIGQTADGTVMLAVTHNRIGGAGPTLGEWAQIMQRLGAVNALNLDGGSSTTLYLGGQLLDRHPSTAVRVQNGIGIFF
jgi:exopolysaccharide biosynthesis protein